MTLKIGVITLFPEMFAAMNFGVVGRAIEQQLVTVQYWNPRDYAALPHRQVDDKPYGGGPGMVMMYEPLRDAILEAKKSLPGCLTVYLSPQGQTIEQAALNTFSANKQSLLLIAGRYEGIDERIIKNYVDQEWSIGQFVLSGGELAAMVFIDAIIRLLPGSLGHPNSAGQDSFMGGLLDHPHYTRPASIDGHDVPSVLLSGNHNEIARWRKKQSLGATWLKRPDLLEQYELSDLDKAFLVEFQSEHGD